MRDNLYNKDDAGLITKKIGPLLDQTLSLVDCLKLCIYNLDDTFRNKPSEKAELFNNCFYEQFSGPSNYNTDIHFFKPH